MAQKFTTVEVVVIVDSDGDSAFGADANEARERYEESIQDISLCDGFRLVKVSVRVPLPDVAILELTASADELGAPSGNVA